MPELACVNGTFSPIDQARVSIEDRGFQFADGVYEVISFRGPQPIMLPEHLERLRGSCREILLAHDFEHLRLESLIREGVRRAELPETLVYVQITRGAAPRNHLFPSDVQPTLVMTFRRKPTVPAAKRSQGIAVCTVPDDRWGRCHIKSIALLANVLARNAAAARGFDDALFIGPEGEIHETAAANFFAVRSGQLWTPIEDSSILSGITRRWILDCARRLDVPACERNVALSHVLSADEAFVSSTSVELLPVVRVDDHTIGLGLPGPISRAIHELMLRDLPNGEVTR